jgi:hypothetical protein
LPEKKRRDLDGPDTKAVSGDREAVAAAFGKIGASFLAGKLPFFASRHRRGHAFVFMRCSGLTSITPVTEILDGVVCARAGYGGQEVQLITKSGGIRRRRRAFEDKRKRSF